MTIVADANVAIAVLNPSHMFHRAALGRCLSEEDVAILNLTRAEALIHPTRLGQFTAADRELTAVGFRTVTLSDTVADKSRELRATHGNKNFPLIDAIVVALGIEEGWPILTCDGKWPTIEEADIDVLT